MVKGTSQIDPCLKFYSLCCMIVSLDRLYIKTCKSRTVQVAEDEKVGSYGSEVLVLLFDYTVASQWIFLQARRRCLVKTSVYS